jgi:tRNA modification GTPase
LFNALVGAERAIVTEIPGTTRDAIEAPVSCNGYPIRLVDTAGLRSSGDRIEQMGIEVSHRFLDQADLILFCADSGRPLESVEREFLASAAAPVVVVRTKADLAPDSSSGADEVSVAATTGAGIVELRETIADVAFANLVSQARLDPIVTRARHRAALEKGLAEIQSFADARASGLEGAVAAVHLRAAVGALEDVIGVVTHDDVLDRVFGNFCIGK